MIDAFHRSARFLLHRRRAGKIAGLPPAIREQINLMLHDGLPYTTIIARLGDAGKHLNKDNLSRWRKADHQDWLAEQTWRPATANPSDLAPEERQLTDLLLELDADSLQNMVSRRPDKFVPILNLAVRRVDLSGDHWPAPLPPRPSRHPTNA